jgi:alkanesulfonate monooxygenase SsuD/methylene tetrahydromethanopterin reductase-like flavin-dependent oxidoreductase (luciferase family)
MKFYCFLQGAWHGRTKPIKQVYEEIIAEAVYAEELGYDGIFLAEQNLVSFLATPDPLQFAAIIAQKTKRIKIGVAIFVLPFHHPLRLAGEIAQLDLLTDGRFEVGIGRGASPYQAKRYERDMPDDASRRFFEEHLKIMMTHWTDPDVDHAHEGEFFRYPDTTVMPGPFQRPHPRLWMAANTVRSVDWSVKLGYHSDHLVAPFVEPYSWVEQLYHAFEKALSDINRPRRDSDFGINRRAYVAPTVEEAREILPFIRDNNRVVVQQVQLQDEKIKNGEYNVDKPVPGEPSLDEMYLNTLVGTPDEVREKVRQHYELGVDVISAHHHLGQPHEKVRRSMELFAREVMPEFRTDWRAR